MSSQSILGKLGISGLNSDSSGFAQPRSFLRIHITAQGLAGVLTAQVLGERAESALPALPSQRFPLFGVCLQKMPISLCRPHGKGHSALSLLGMRESTELRAQCPTHPSNVSYPACLI